MKKIITLPKYKDIKNGDVFEIKSQSNHFTHNFFKYPAKFIPEIARWSIKNFSVEKDYVLDCFAGSGTSLVEASLLKRRPLAIDFDPLSILIIKSKSKKLKNNEINIIRKHLNNIVNKKPERIFIPKLDNLDKWFPNKNIERLSIIISNINKFKKKDKNIYNFLAICFASIIRKSSYADDTSPKPYVSKRFKKEPRDPSELFIKVVEQNIEKLQDKKFNLHYQVKIIGNDARETIEKKYKMQVQHILSSPPYINAFDYVRITRLENLWLGNYIQEEIIGHKKKQIGTELIPSNLYNKIPPKFGINKLDKKILNVFKKDKRRAWIVFQYFNDMSLNLYQSYEVLKSGGVYTIVVGDCSIKGEIFEIYKYLITFAKKIGFKNKKYFSYLIKNPYLRIPRSGKGGYVEYDRVLILKK